MTSDPPEIEDLEQTAAAQFGRAEVARALEALAADLRRNDNTALWPELRSLTNWLAESDAISDYASLAAAYRARIGLTDHPANGAAYLQALLGIARSLI